MTQTTLARRIADIQPSATLTLSAHAAALKAAGRDIVNMGVGEPDFDTPALVRAAAIEAMNGGATRYTPTTGTRKLREAVAAKLAHENGLLYTPEDIVVSNGGKQAIHNIVSALVEPGDEVIVPAPCWVTYIDVTKLCEGVPVVIPCPLENGFRLQPGQLAECLTSRTRLLFLNSPGNPSGAMYSRKELEAIGKVLQQFPHVWIVSDDIYEHILVGDQPMLNIAMVCPELASRVIVVNGVSKAFAMTGWRIGYSANAAGLARAFETVQSQTTGSPNAIAQAASVTALQHSADLVAPMATAYRHRHAVMCEALQGIEGLSFRPSEGSFYIFVRVQQVIERLHAAGHLTECTDIAFSQLLLERGLAVVPGSAFAAPGHLRLSFATNEANIELACARLRETCAL